MVFWLAVLTGGLFAWIAVPSGFLAAWIRLFNLVLSAYVAIFLTPVIVATIPAATETPYGYTLVLLSVAIATLLIAYGICYACLSGQLHARFPSAMNSVGAGVLGFFSGFLVCSFLTFSLAITPLGAMPVLKTLGLEAKSQQTNTSYVCWWCDILHSMVASSDTELPSSQDAVALLVGEACPALPKSAPNAPTERTESPASSQSASQSPAAPRVPPAPVAGNSATEWDPSEAPSVKPPAPPAPRPSPAAPWPLQADASAAPRAPDDKALEKQIALRRRNATLPAEIDAAIADPQVKIIEVADSCTSDRLSLGQAKHLADWVSKGGVLWANNDILATLFSVHSEVLSHPGSELRCIASQRAQAHPILVGCNRVVLKDFNGKAYKLSCQGAVQLLILENSSFALSGNNTTCCWSLVPYGKGWISDLKPVDTTQYDGARFWHNFCRFCLQDKPAAPTAASAVLSGLREPSPEGPLSGDWLAAAGARFRIEDDGKEVTVRLMSSTTLRNLMGTLARSDEDPKSLTGSFNVLFPIMGAGPVVVNVRAIVNSPDQIRLRCTGWPIFNNRGRVIGKDVLNEVWMRAEAPLAAPADPEEPPSPLPLQ